MDRYYTQISVADWLLEKKITMIGTFQRNLEGIPEQVKSLKDREAHSYKVYWDSSNEVMNLHSYAVVNKSKGSKNVLLLSTMEPLIGTAKDDKNKLPAVIALYNFTKGGTDIMDQVRLISKFANQFLSRENISWV